ncbi:MAG: hypothetical protein R3304_10025 [Longimicrobiales bacterium]|nr:hypothetical protein [Longimicrobiales bacterium]
MTDRCATVREAIPDVAAGRATAGVERLAQKHVATCRECRAELALARAVYATRAHAPEGTAERVLAALRSQRRTRSRAGWGLAAAAVAALALGIGIASGPHGVPDVATAELGEDETEGELWLSDDGVLAGAPVWETLSDEALAELLEELVPSPTGGQA